MTRKEIEARIETLEAWRFELKMKDRWTFKDYTTDDKWFAELVELKEKLRNL